MWPLFSFAGKRHPRQHLKQGQIHGSCVLFFEKKRYTDMKMERQPFWRCNSYEKWWLSIVMFIQNHLLRDFAGCDKLWWQKRWPEIRIEEMQLISMKPSISPLVCFSFSSTEKLSDWDGTISWSFPTQPLDDANLWHKACRDAKVSHGNRRGKCHVYFPRGEIAVPSWWWGAFL